jgi:MazG family protein
LLDALVTEARLRFGLDLSHGLQVVPAEGLVAIPIEASRPLIVAPVALLRPALDASTEARPLPGRHGPAGRDPLSVLRRLYPADHPVGRFGGGEGLSIGSLSVADLATALYVGPLPPEEAFAGPWAMPAISARLREPDGCPWDREQTHESLRHHLLEEAYEVYDALAEGASPELAAELGDLWLQVVLHAQLAAEAGVFDLADVQAAIAAKIVRRHPHVFGDAEARTASDVNRQWERIKKSERGEGEEEPATGALDGIVRSLPALAASAEMQERAASLGYDWPSIDGVYAKVAEELAEVRSAEASDGPGSAHVREEVGDLLFVLANVARKLGADPEAALRAANEKFRRRFRIVERLASEQGRTLREMSFAELDGLWDAAKVEDGKVDDGRAAEEGV